MPVKVLRFKNLPSVPLMLQDRDLFAASRRQQPERVCICGKCSCRKHHCPIHHFPATLGPGTTQQHEGAAKATDYNDTFQVPPMVARRGLKLPLVITHSELNKQIAEVKTEQGSAYKPFADTKPAKSCRRTEEYAQSTAPLSDETSYKAEFQQPGSAHLPRPQYGRHLQSTLCMNDRTGVHYGTTNTEHFKGWPSSGPQYPIGEPVGESLFQGSFKGNSVMQSDFSSSVVRGGRPSTSFKKQDDCYQSNAPFRSDTTAHSDFTPPAPSQRVPVQSKRNSKKNAGTMHLNHPDMRHAQPNAATTGPLPNVATGPLPKVPIHLTVPPAVDLSHCAHHLKGPTQTVSQATYAKSWGAGQPKPRTSYKIKADYSLNPAPFKAESSTLSHFRPMSPRQRDALLHEVDCRAAELSHLQQLGVGVKRASNFATGAICSDTTTQQDFKPWRAHPHIRLGDQVERSFQQSLEPFETQSSHQSAYTWIKAVPAETCKPLDMRFSKGGWVPREGEVGVSSYQREFKELALPQATRCPAHTLLYPTATLKN